MPNKNYLRGRRYEYQLMETLEKQGLKVYRMAGSHGEVDLISFYPGPKGSVVGYQCKTKLTKGDAHEQVEYLPDIGCMKVIKMTKFIRRKNARKN